MRKEIFQRKVNRLIDEELSKDQADTYLAHTFSNFTEIQKRVIRRRISLIVLIIVSILLAVEIITLKGFLFFESSENIPLLKWLGLTSVNHLLLIIILPVFIFNYLLVIKNITYRNQQRYIQERYYKKYLKSLYDDSLHLFSYPQYSLGQITKVCSHLTELGIPEEQAMPFISRSIDRYFREFMIKSERWIPLLYIAASTFYLIWFFYESSPSLIIFTLVLSAFIFGYIVYFYFRYHGIKLRSDKKKTVIKANHKFLDTVPSAQ